MDLTGRVYTNAGAAKVGLAVTIKDNADDSTEGSDTTDSNGEWSVTALDDDKTYYIEIVDGSNKYVIHGGIDVQFRNVCCEIRQTPDPTTLTISGGAGSETIAVTQDFHTVSDADATANLYTISGGYVGQEVVFTAASGKTITFKHNASPSTNEIICGSDRSVAGDDQICLKFGGTYWRMCWFADNT